MSTDKGLLVTFACKCERRFASIFKGEIVWCPRHEVYTTVQDGAPVPPNSNYLASLGS